jgi:hypothetical protein
MSDCASATKPIDNRNQRQRNQGNLTRHSAGIGCDRQLKTQETDAPIFSVIAANTTGTTRGVSLRASGSQVCTAITGDPLTAKGREERKKNNTVCNWSGRAEPLDNQEY